MFGEATYDPSGIQALAAAQSSGSDVLKSIDLSFYDLDAEAGKAFASALKVNAVLTECNVRGYSRHREGCHALWHQARPDGGQLKWATSWASGCHSDRV